MAKGDKGGWSDWNDRGSGDSYKEKVTAKDSGETKYERLDSIDRDKNDHQHSWVNRDSSGKVTSGGATPDRGGRGSRSRSDSSDDSSSGK